MMLSTITPEDIKTALVILLITAVILGAISKPYDLP
jgi:hypothetical protein